MKIFFKAIAVCAFLAATSFASFSNSSKVYIAEQYYIFNGGKLTDAYFNMYNYVGGTYQYQIKLNDQTSGIPAKSDLTALRGILEDAARTWTPIYGFNNDSPPTTGWVYTGNSLRLFITRN